MQTAKGIVALLGCLLVVVITTSRSVAMQCPAKVSEEVVLTTPEDAYGKLLQANPAKDEFETSAEYEARRRAGAVKAGLGDALAIESVYYSKNVRYDADSGFMFVGEYAWDNMGVGWDRAENLGKEVGRFANVLGIGLKSEETAVGTYEASNAMGATVTVVQIERTNYAIFDRVLTRHSSLSDKAAREWETEEQKQIGNLMVSGIRIKMERGYARYIKSKIRIGVMIIPKEPFTDTGTRYWEPTIDRPREVFQTTKFIVADILCVLLMNDAEKVLATVAPNK